MKKNNEIYTNSKNKSIVKPISSKRQKKQIKTIATMVFLSTIIVTSLTMPKINEAKNSIESYNLSSTIGSIIEPGSPENIISKNTHRTEDKNNYYYNFDGLAKDILRYEPEFFDVVLYNTYNNINYKNSMNDLMSSIKIIVNNSPEEYPELYINLKGVNNFDDYLQKKHFVDSEGKVSLKMYEKYGTGLENVYKDILENEARKEISK